MYLCPTCEKEIVHDQLFRVERLPGGKSPLLDEENDLIRITYRHPCSPEPLCVAFMFELSALRRLFPGHQTVLMPWPKVQTVGNGIAVPIDWPSRGQDKSHNERLLERTAWEMAQLDTVNEFLLYCRGPRQPEELRKDTANEEDAG